MTTATQKRRRPLAEMQLIACQLLDLLEPVTERRQVVGSVRRREPLVGDLEILVSPKLEPYEVNLFGEVLSYCDLLQNWHRDQLRDGTYTHRLSSDGKRADGGKYKRLTSAGVAFDLFICRPGEQEFGVLEAIRTGPADFSRRLVTQRSAGGMLPFGMRVADGVLWHGNRKVETPDERDFFDAIGVVWIPPEMRA